MNVDNGFSGLDLSHHVLKDLEYHDFEEPLPIQDEAIPILLEGKDLIAEAKTGTGKTLAFAIPIVEGVKCKGRQEVQALVLAPTRELAQQVAKETKKIGYKKKVDVLAIYGGTSIKRQSRKLKKGVSVVVGTPGRVLDLIRRKILRLKRVNMLVLDEADRMLDMGFIKDIKKIVSHIPQDRQTMLFSATIPEEIRELAQSIMRNPQTISISSDNMTVEEIEQCYYEIPQKDKFDAFVKIIKEEKPESAIVFCNTKKWTRTLSRLMNREGFRCKAINGDLSQKQRDKVMGGFRKNKFRFLIATNVAARGLDIEDISHIFNYDIPQHPDSYIHRIGRTGRVGKKGKAISLINPREIRDLWDIENRCQIEIQERSL